MKLLLRALLFVVLWPLAVGAQEPPTVTVKAHEWKQPDGTIRYAYRVINGSNKQIVKLSVGKDYYHGLSELLTKPLNWEYDTGLAGDSWSAPAGWSARLILTEESNVFQIQWQHANDGVIAPGESAAGFSVVVPKSDARYLKGHWTVFFGDGDAVIESSTLAPDDNPLPLSWYSECTGGGVSIPDPCAAPWPPQNSAAKSEEDGLASVPAVIPVVTARGVVAEPPTVTVKVHEWKQADGTVRYAYRVINGGPKRIVRLSVGWDYYHGLFDLLTRPSGWQFEAGLAGGSWTAPAGWRAELTSMEESETFEIHWRHANKGVIAPGESASGFSVVVPKSDARYLKGHWTVLFAGPGLESSTLVPDDNPLPLSWYSECTGGGDSIPALCAEPWPPQNCTGDCTPVTPQPPDPM